MPFSVQGVHQKIIHLLRPGISHEASVHLASKDWSNLIHSGLPVSDHRFMDSIFQRMADASTCFHDECRKACLMRLYDEFTAPPPSKTVARAPIELAATAVGELIENESTDEDTVVKPPRKKPEFADNVLSKLNHPRACGLGPVYSKCRCKEKFLAFLDSLSDDDHEKMTAWMHALEQFHKLGLVGEGASPSPPCTRSPPPQVYQFSKSLPRVASLPAHGQKVPPLAFASPPSASLRAPLAFAHLTMSLPMPQGIAIVNPTPGKGPPASPSRVSVAGPGCTGRRPSPVRAPRTIAVGSRCPMASTVVNAFVARQELGLAHQGGHGSRSRSRCSVSPTAMLHTTDEWDSGMFSFGR